MQVVHHRGEVTGLDPRDRATVFNLCVGRKLLPMSAMVRHQLRNASYTPSRTTILISLGIITALISFKAAQANNRELQDSAGFSQKHSNNKATPSDRVFEQRTVAQQMIWTEVSVYKHNLDLPLKQKSSSRPRKKRRRDQHGTQIAKVKQPRPEVGDPRPTVVAGAVHQMDTRPGFPFGFS